MAVIKYEKEFKVAAVKQVTENGREEAEVASSLGIHVQTLYKWIRIYRNNGEKAFPGSGNASADKAEFILLKKENKDLRETNEILKKAMAFFVKGQ